MGSGPDLHLPNIQMYKVSSTCAASYICIHPSCPGPSESLHQLERMCCTTGSTCSPLSSQTTLLTQTTQMQVGWLPQTTLRDHTTGTEQRYTLKAATSRRPSWQESSPWAVRW